MSPTIRGPADGTPGAAGDVDEPSAVVIQVFAKAPRAGHVKTRLAAEIGGDAAARLAAALLGDTLDLLRSWGRAPVWLLGDAAGTEPLQSFRDAGADGINYRYQGPGDLGARLRRSIAAAFDAGATAVIALGADTPHLPIEHLDGALRMVEEGRLVLGPAVDGGYYLIGVPRQRRHQLSALFGEAAGDVAWGGPTVLAETRRRLEDSSISWSELPEFWDIDRRSDLVQWKQQKSCGQCTIPPRSAAVLAALLPG